MLFAVAMDALTSLIIKAEREGVLILLPGCSPLQRLSIYADDVVLFIKSTAPDLSFFREALSIFGGASRLHINFTKSSAILIRSDESDRDRVAAALPWKISNFP